MYGPCALVHSHSLLPFFIDHQVILPYISPGRVIQNSPRTLLSSVRTRLSKLLNSFPPTLKIVPMTLSQDIEPWSRSSLNSVSKPSLRIFTPANSFVFSCGENGVEQKHGIQDLKRDIGDVKEQSSERHLWGT